LELGASTSRSRRLSAISLPESGQSGAFAGCVPTYDDHFQTSLRAELSKGVTELGSNPADYGLTVEPVKEGASKPGPK
jgi:hypothetical protein